MPQGPGAIRATTLVVVAAASTLAVGVLILAGGAQRFSAPAFATARGVAPWWAWGAAMTLSGILAGTGGLIHQVRLARLGHSLSSVVYLFWVITLAAAIIPNPTQALTGLGIYSGFAILHAFAAASADLESATRRANRFTKESRQRYEAVGGDEA